MWAYWTGATVLYRRMIPTHTPVSVIFALNLAKKLPIFCFSIEKYLWCKECSPSVFHFFAYAALALLNGFWSKNVYGYFHSSELSLKYLQFLISNKVRTTQGLIFWPGDYLRHNVYYKLYYDGKLEKNVPFFGVSLGEWFCQKWKIPFVGMNLGEGIFQDINHWRTECRIIM